MNLEIFIGDVLQLLLTQNIDIDARSVQRQVFGGTLQKISRRSDPGFLPGDFALVGKAPEYVLPQTDECLVRIAVLFEGLLVLGLPGCGINVECREIAGLGLHHFLVPRKPVVDLRPDLRVCLNYLVDRFRNRFSLGISA